MKYQYVIRGATVDDPTRFRYFSVESNDGPDSTLARLGRSMKEPGRELASLTVYQQGVKATGPDGNPICYYELPAPPPCPECPRPDQYRGFLFVVKVSDRGGSPNPQPDRFKLVLSIAKLDAPGDAAPHYQKAKADAVTYGVSSGGGDHGEATFVGEVGFYSTGGIGGTTGAGVLSCDVTGSTLPAATNPYE